MESQTQEPASPGPAGTNPADLAGIAAVWEEWDASPAGRADATGRQRQVAGTLGTLLALACRQGLPPVSWTVTCTEPQLLARCDGYPNRRRPEHFAEWKAALTELAGPPDYEAERAFARGGQTRASAVWENSPGVRVCLSAEWDTPDPDGQSAGIAS